MYKAEKLQKQEQIEKYLEENQIYDIFENIMKGLIKEKPEDPILFMISKLETPEPKRIFIIGPPGSRKKEKALTLAEAFNYATVSVCDLLEREISKKSELGKKIKETKAKFSFVPDDIVIELVNQQLVELEREGKDYIIEGYPNTRVQANALQRMGIVPDKFFILKVTETMVSQKIKEDVTANTEEGALAENEAEQIAKNAITEYNMNVKDVKQEYAGFYCEIDTSKDHDMVVNDLARTMKLRLGSKAPKRPARVLLMGAPGSGKTTLGELIAKKFGLIYVNASNLLDAQIANKTSIGKAIEDLSKETEVLPDEIILQLVETRLNEPDCKVNGWVLEGFPKTEGQMSMMKSLRQAPSLVVVLQIDDDIVYERHEYKKTDSMTGETYNLKFLAKPLPEEVLQRLVSKDEDRYEMVKKKLKAWKELLPKLEEEFKERRLLLNADKSVETLAEAISEAIENSIH